MERPDAGQHHALQSLAKRVGQFPDLLSRKVYKKEINGHTKKSNSENQQRQCYATNRRP